MIKKLNCVMVIDDDEPTNYISTLLLEEADCARHIEIMDSGKKALEYLRCAAAGDDGKARGYIMPELILLDINMPCMNGWEFLEEFEKQGNNSLQKTVIIMLTTSFSLTDKLRAESIAALSGFEHKPLTPGLINRIIATWFTAASKDDPPLNASNFTHQ